MLQIPSVYSRKRTIYRIRSQTTRVNFSKAHLYGSPRLRRTLLDIAQYNPKVIYRKGKDIPIPDILSRDCENSISIPEAELEVLVVLPLSPTAFSEFEEAAKSDLELQLLVKTILTG